MCKALVITAGDLERLFTDERVRLAMSFQTKYLGMSPFQAPSLFTILAFLEYEHGIFHAKGGLGSITKRMAEIAIELGVDIRLETSVEELLLDGKKVIGVKTNHGDILCDKVVMNADFANAMTTLVPNQKREVERQETRKEIILMLNIHALPGHGPHMGPATSPNLCLVRI